MHSAPRLPSNSVGQLTALKIPSSHSSNTMPESKRVREAAASYVSRHTRTSNGARTLNSSMQATYIETGMYLDTQVAVKRVGKAVYLSRAILHDLRLLRDINHDNVNRFVGLCTEAGNESIIAEYCSKGSLGNLLDNDAVNLDETFRFSLMNDIIQGMCYIHSSPFHSHGRLNSSNCLVDGRMLVQIADLGLWPLRRRYLAFLDPEAEEAEIRPLLWVAPEHLREPMPVNGTPKGDVYGFAIILQEIVSRLPPYHDNASDTRSKEYTVRNNSPRYPHFSRKASRVLYEIE
ncbi:hypothetical protein RvY_04652-4 [Ramazzottius varieornatus]|uniref:guanylate cyclase n=1 Tax=Ramazzottius varieornatus TaxID=947166 RepID=A0A1D1V1J3_RAMVA|nr:hypothetical protein RvY_04652-4 [Ramazzottius varieornatus]